MTEPKKSSLKQPLLTSEYIYANTSPIKSSGFNIVKPTVYGTLSMNTETSYIPLIEKTTTTINKPYFHSNNKNSNNKN